MPEIEKEEFATLATFIKRCVNEALDERDRGKKAPTRDGGKGANGGGGILARMDAALDAAFGTGADRTKGKGATGKTQVADGDANGG